MKKFPSKKKCYSIMDKAPNHIDKEIIKELNIKKLFIL